MYSYVCSVYVCLCTCSCFFRKGSVLSYDLPSPIQPKLRNFASCYFWLTSFAIPNEVACDSRRCFKCRSLNVPICRKLANSATGLIGLYPTPRCISKHKMRHLYILAKQNSSLLPFTHHNTTIYILHYHLHTTVLPFIHNTIVYTPQYSFTHYNTTIYTLQYYHFTHYNTTIYTLQHTPKTSCFFFCHFLKVGSIFTMYQCEKFSAGPKEHAKVGTHPPALEVLLRRWGMLAQKGEDIWGQPNLKRKNKKKKNRTRLMAASGGRRDSLVTELRELVSFFIVKVST